MNLLPILFSILVYLMQDLPEKNAFVSPGPAIAAPLMLCDRRSDSLELVRFYNATGGPNWWKKWDLSKPINAWWGVKISSMGCVTHLELGDTSSTPCCTGNNLSGILINFNLPELIEINLGNNPLIGGLISNFDKLPNLRQLGLNNNQLIGSIPNFDKLPNLQGLTLHNNNLSGNIPNFDKLPNLQRVLLYKNQLKGSIPNFDKLPLLRALLLSDNQLSGYIPNFDKISNLEQFWLQNNQLSGSIPNFDKLPLLDELLFENNQLNGSIPNFNKLLNLRRLHCDNNQLSGSIPNFDKLPKLYLLTLSNNQLNSSVPNFDKLSNLRELWLQNNQLSGSIPNFDKLPNLNELLLANNKLTGSIPNFDKLINLYRLRLDNNQLSGVIPNLNKSLLDPLFLSIFNNLFTFSSIIPNINNILNQKDSSRYVYSPQNLIFKDTSIVISTNTPYTLDLLIDDTVTTSTYAWYKNDVLYKTIKGSNKLPFSPFTAADAGTYTVKITNPLAPQLTLESHPIRLVAGPQLVCDRRLDSLELIKFYNATGGPNWWKKWDLTKPISTWHGILLDGDCVFSIDLDDTIENSPCCAGSGNNLIGSIISLDLPFLNLLNLGNNKLSGTIPNFDKLPNLGSLSLGSNQLTDTVPNFDKLPNLGILMLSSNQLIGHLPDFNNLRLLNRLFISENKLSGSIPDFNLPNLLTLDLGNNQLTGSIPDFDNLALLLTLDLRNNQLTNTVPDFNNLPNLGGLYLHSNQLTGTIPGFNNLLKLESLFLYDNRMTFSNLIKNLSKIKQLIEIKNNSPNNFIYAPQQKIYSDTTITIPPCSDYILDLKIDDTVTTSYYAWFKNGVQDSIIKGSNKRRFTNFNSAHVGTYTVKITNPLAPQLTLESHPIRLAVGTGLCCDRRSDSLELVKFYNSTGGPSNWWKKWDLSKPMNTWWGIELNPSGCVKTLRVSDTTLNGFTACCSGNNLVGTFPDIYLPELEVFHCQNNTGITGQIPNFNFPNLVELTIFTCMVNGSIPNFDKLTKLRFLNLHDNKLTGSIPNFRNLKNLEDLNLSVNSLSGPIPDFPSFQKLLKLELYSNQLAGLIPDFSSMPNLVLLYLQSNRLTENIPNFRNLVSLTCLGLDDNMLNGPIPKFEFLTKLEVVGISNNMLSGFLPDYLSNTGLASVTIDGNCYTFSGLTANALRVQDLAQRNMSSKCPGSPEIFDYHPQKKIYSDTSITILACSEYVLDLKIDDMVTTSTYAWFKNGAPDTIIIGSNKRRFSNFSPEKAGTYTVKITNPLAPQLTLESHPIRLVSSGTMTNINNHRDTSLTCGLSFRLAAITGLNLGSDAAYFTGPGRTGTRYASGQSITADATLYVHTTSGGCFDEDTFRIQFTVPVIIARPDTARTKAGKSVPFDVLANDIIPAGLATQVTIDNPANGSILYSTSSGRGTYTPKIGFVGTEVLNYTVCIVDCPASCKSSTLTIIVEGPCGDRNSIVLPNVIFPTGNGDNRYFIVEAISECPDAWGPKPHKLQVFNRWGNEVYRNDNYLNDWDGTNTSGQPLPEGTYYYLLDLGSVAAPVRGYVVIMR